MEITQNEGIAKLFPNATSVKEIASDLLLIVQNNGVMKFYKPSSGRTSGIIYFDQNKIEKINEKIYLLPELSGNRKIIFSSASMNTTFWLCITNHKLLSANILRIESYDGETAFVKLPSLHTTSWLLITKCEKINENLYLITDFKGRVRSFESNFMKFSGCLSATDCENIKQKTKSI